RIAQQGVLAGEIGAAGGSCALDQRAEARVAADDVLGCELVVEDGVDRVEQERLLVAVGVGAFGDRTAVRIVGETDHDQTVVPRHSEDVAAEATGTGAVIAACGQPRRAAGTRMCDPLLGASSTSSESVSDQTPAALTIGRARSLCSCPVRETMR